MGRDEVLEHRHALAEVAPHRDIDDAARRVGHEAAHAAELADLALVAAGARVGHHADGAVLVEALHHCVGELGGRPLPDLHNLLVTLVICDQAALELAIDLVDCRVRLSKAPNLVGRNHDVGHRDCHAAAGRVLEANCLDTVHNVGGLRGAEDAVALIDEAPQLGPLHVHVLEAEPIGHDLVEDDPADGGAHSLLESRLGVFVPNADHRRHGLVERDSPKLVGKDRLGLAGEEAGRLSLGQRLAHRQVETAQNHVLGRRHDRAAVRRGEQIGR